MKIKLFVFFAFFIQLGFSQDSLIDKLRDTIIVDKNFIKQLDNKFVKTVNFKIDGSNFFLNNKEYENTFVNVLFINKTKSFINIHGIMGGSNYFCSDRMGIILFPNDTKSIKMTLGVNNGRTKWGRTLLITLSGGDVTMQRVLRHHVFELINKKTIVKKKNLD